MKGLKRAIGIICFVLIFVGVFFKISDIFMHKQVEGRWNMTAKVAGFYNEKKDSIDVLFFGSSHMYCSIEPALLEKETGYSSYVFATQNQPLWITYHYMIETFKTQNPEIMIVEVNVASEENDFADDGTNYTAIDPIPFSTNKLKMIWASAPKGERRYYVFNLMKYHDRWEELDKNDYIRTYETQCDPDRGYVRLETAALDIEREDISGVEDVKVANEKNVLYLNKIIDLAEDKGVRLILLKAPSNANKEEKMYYNGVASIARLRAVEFIDYNDDKLYKEVGLDIDNDFYDRQHLNEDGMKKFTAHFGRLLLSKE